MGVGVPATLLRPAPTPEKTRAGQDRHPTPPSQPKYSGAGTDQVVKVAANMMIITPIPPTPPLGLKKYYNIFQIFFTNSASSMPVRVVLGLMVEGGPMKELHLQGL